MLHLFNPFLEDYPRFETRGHRAGGHPSHHRGGQAKDGLTRGRRYKAADGGRGERHQGAFAHLLKCLWQTLSTLTVALQLHDNGDANSQQWEMKS